MRKILFTALFLACACAAEAQSAAPKMERWQDPNIYEVNRAPMRSSFIVYPSVEDAKTGSCYKSSPLYRSIEGVWNFAWFEHRNTPRPADFYAVNFDDSEWGKMPVPGLWEMNGYGVPIYVNKGYVWNNNFVDNPPFTPDWRNHVGLYRREVEVPAEWKGKQLFVHFGSVTSNMTLYVNGKEVGYSEDSKLEAEFDITKFVKFGEKNLFALEVHRLCDGSYLEDQDFWRLSGIARVAYIYARDKRHLKDVKFVAELAHEYKDGHLDVKVETTPGVKKVNLVLRDAEGREVLAASATPDKTGKVEECLHLHDVKAWSAECPNLYTLTVEATDGAKCIEAAAFNVGFRTVEIKNAQLLVNGQPVLVKGANRHEMHPNRGYHLTYEDMVRDIQLMKELNLNAVRTCHYPDSPMWYDLCDRYGIYVVDEGNIESHGMGYKEKTLAIREDYKAAHLIRDQRMVLRDFNHPSVIIWSLGNEAGNGSNFHACYDWIKAYDKSRPVQFEQACFITYKDIPKNYNSDIECPMYADYKECEEYLTSQPKRPLIQCEYAHAMGQSIGSFKEYWDLVRKYPNYQGGFIWDFVDQALARRDAQGVTYTYGGCYNDFDYSDETFCCNGFISAQRKPHTSAWEVKQQYQNIWTSPKNIEAGEVEVYNEYFFRDLSAYRLEWTLTADGKKALAGVVENLEVAPQERKCVKLGYDAADVAALKGEVLLTVRFVLKRAEPLLEPGHEVAFNQFALRAWDAAASYAKATTPTQGEALRICRDSRTVYGADFSISFAGQGWLEDYTLRGRKMIAEPLQPMFYRPMTENDYGVRKRARNAHIYHSHKALRNPKYAMTMFLMEPKGENVEVYTEYRIDELGARAVVIYKISPDGTVAVTERFRPSSSYKINLISMLRFGVALAMPDTYDTIKFYGAGPHESYCDRKNGNKVGVYTQSVDEQFCMTYVRPQESGSHCDLRWWRITDSSGHGLEVRSNVLFAASAIPYPMSQIDIHSEDYRKYPTLLEKTGKTYVNIDMAQAGLVCEDSWGAVQLPQYRIPYEKHTFEFVLKPLR